MTGVQTCALPICLKRCFPKAGLFGVDRKFQQYELLVAGNCALSPAEFADFLTTRTGTRFSLAQVPTAANPLPVETGLTYANAEQFFRDYSAIGLKMIVRLVRPQPD